MARNKEAQRRYNHNKRLRQKQQKVLAEFARVQLDTILPTVTEV